MARLSICSECEQIVFIDSEGDYVVLDNQEMMHARCYVVMQKRAEREFESTLDGPKPKTVSTEPVAKKKRRSA